MLVVLITVVTILAIAYIITNHLDSKDIATNDQLPQLTKEELQNIKLAEELYDKDLRPVVGPNKQSNQPRPSKKANTSNKKQNPTTNK